MSKMKTFFRLFFKDRTKIGIAIADNISKSYISRFIPDKIYLELQYVLRFGKKLNLKNPRSFNEKLQWIKLFDRNPLYTVLVDKYAVREFVAQKIGTEYLIPLYFKCESLSNDLIDLLPDSFVLKCTHDSKSVIICKNKQEFDFENARKFLMRRLKKNFFYYGREWPYKNVRPCIVAEKYMEDEDTHELRDYKFYCFNGLPRFMMLNSGRGKNTKADYFDMNGFRLPFVWGYPNSVNHVKLPNTFLEMIRLAEILSKDFLHVRVDFYEVNGKVYFGEMTFFDGSGFSKFNPDYWDEKIGDYIDLNLLADGKGTRFQ